MATYDFCEYSPTGGFVYKTTTAGYYFNGTTFEQFQNGTFNASPAGTASTLMTISAVSSGKVQVGQTLTGGTLTGGARISSFGTFNGTSGTVNLDTAQTWANNTTVTGTNNYPATTVNGVVYLDGYIFVMDANGTIYNSDLQIPQAWYPLNFITAEVDPSAGKAIAKYHNYIVAFSDRSVEFFYDAGNATGSPLARMAQNAAQVGCDNGYSVAYCSGSVFWLGKNKNRGRGIYMLNGLIPQVVSTPAIDRVLDTLTLTTLHAFGFRINGSHFYMLNCISDNLTLVYDVSNQLWAQWTYCTAGTTQSVTSVTQVNGLATATKAAHGYTTGDLVRIEGASPTGYNGDYLINVLTSSTFTYEVDSTIAATATGTITATKYTDGYMPFVSYTYSGNKDLLQHETDGYVYEITPNVFQDLQTTTGSPIHSVARTNRIDGGDLKQKVLGTVMVVGDQVNTRVYVLKSNDDSQTYTSPRSVHMSSRIPRINRVGSARRAVFELHHVDNSRCRLEAIELGD
jgi:hypothetical protein